MFRIFDVKKFERKIIIEWGDWKENIPWPQVGKIAKKKSNNYLMHHNINSFLRILK